jgi:short-subunit dehydrogenase
MSQKAREVAGPPFFIFSSFYPALLYLQHRPGQVKKSGMPPKPTALITGSASGLGYEMAKILAQQGYDLYLVDIQKEAIDRISDELSVRYNISALAYSIDLSLPDAAEKVYKDCSERKLDVEVLISNAGFFFFSEVAQADPEIAAKMIRLHVHTPSMLAIYFAGDMKQKQRGYIMMTSSVSAYQTFPGIGFYAASKSYLKAFCESMRHELRYHGVYVTTLCPGATATNLYDPSVINVKTAKRWGIMMDPHKVAAAGINGMLNRKAIVMPGLMTKVLTLLSVLTPDAVIYWARVRWKRLF